MQYPGHDVRVHEMCTFLLVTFYVFKNFINDREAMTMFIQRSSSIIIISYNLVLKYVCTYYIT